MRIHGEESEGLTAQEIKEREAQRKLLTTQISEGEQVDPYTSLVNEFKLTLHAFGRQDSRAGIAARGHLLYGYQHDEYMRGYQTEERKKPEVTG